MTEPSLLPWPPAGWRKCPRCQCGPFMPQVFAPAAGWPEPGVCIPCAREADRRARDLRGVRRAVLEVLRREFSRQAASGNYSFDDALEAMSESVVKELLLAPELELHGAVGRLTGFLPAEGGLA